MDGRLLASSAILFLCASADAHEGASLRVQWPTAIERPEKLSLLPIDVALSPGLTRARAVKAWTRPITGSEQRWDSLPAGTYQIVVRAASAATGLGVPAEVGEVILGPGDDSTVPIVLPPSLTTREQPAPRTLRVLVPEREERPESLLVSHWRDGVRSDLTATRQQVSGGVLLTVSAPCVAGSAVMIESPTRIGTASFDGACEEPVRVHLAAKADLTARVSVLPGEQPPRSGSLRFAKCTGDVSAIEIPFTISDSRIRTSAPAVCSELSVHAAGFVPVKLSSPAWKAGESRDLGTIALPEGAAAVLRVRAGGDASPLHGVRITAVRPSDLSSMRGHIDAEPIALGTAISDASGWARLSGLPEGRVIFLLQATGRKRPQVSEPFELLAGDETVIDDLVVETPANVFVTVSVPPHLQDAIELHAVELTGTGHTHWPSRVPLRAEPGPAETVVEEVPPGSWTIRATGRLKSGFALRLAETTIDVAPGVDRHVTLLLNDLLFHGRVTSAGVAVTGSINLKPADKRSGFRSAVANIGSDGGFQVLLEGPGQYGVTVQDSSRGRSVMLDRTIAFDDPGDEIAIELPAGREIRGRVVDSAGAAVEGVSVSAAQQFAEPAGAIGVSTSDGGRFVLDGVVSGRWELIAESANERSEPVLVAVGDDDVEGITLIVDPTRIVKVRVVDQTGAPQSFAGVDTEFLAPGAVQPQYYGRLTRARGEAEFRLSRSQQATPTNLVIRTMPEGRLSCEVRRLDADQTIQVGPHSGEVRLIAARQWTAKSGTRNWLVSSRGCAVPFYANVEEESLGRQAMVFKNLATGRWSYVETHTTEQIAAILIGRGTDLPAIATFEVEAGKTTRVDFLKH